MYTNNPGLGPVPPEEQRRSALPGPGINSRSAGKELPCTKIYPQT